jgi:hypothetical protein
MAAEHRVAAQTDEETGDFILPTSLGETKWIRAVDLLPGSRSMVRDAIVQIDRGAVLAVWRPDDDSPSVPPGTAFMLPPGAPIRLTVHYKKNYRDQGTVVGDRSRLGLYFTARPEGGAIETFTLKETLGEGEADPPATFSSVLQTGARLLGVRPILDRDYSSIAVNAVLTTGRRPLLLLRTPRADWPSRYWLGEPVELPSGTAIEVIAVPADLQSTEGASTRRHTLQLAVDVVQTAHP